MRLSLTTFLVCTLPFFRHSPVSAIHPQVPSRREHGHPSSSLVLSSRQHRVPRNIPDLCINASVDLADTFQLGFGLGSNVQLCLCLKDLDIFLDTNVDIEALVDLLGKNTVSALITELINTSSDTSKCSFPPHAHHTCNNHDPCHYECDPHYVRVGDTCVCASPYISCNGDCDIFLKGCGSAVPRSFKARDDSLITNVAANAHVAGSHPVTSQAPATGGSSTGASTSISNTDELSIDLGLSNSLGLLGLLKNGFLGGGLSSTGDVPPVSTTTAGGGDLNPDLVTQLEALVKLGTELLSSYTPSGIASLNASTLSDPSLVDDVVRKIANLFGSPTVTSLATDIDALITAITALQTALANCPCVGLDGVVNHLVLVADAARELKNWCSLNSAVIVQRVVSRPSPPPPDTSLAPSSQGTGDTSIDINHTLSGLGQPTNTIVEVDDRGNGNKLSSSVNGVLNGVGVGLDDDAPLINPLLDSIGVSNGLRRRVTREI